MIGHGCYDSIRDVEECITGVYLSIGGGSEEKF